MEKVEMMYVSTFALCRNASGSSEIYKTEVLLRRAAYDAGEHYEIAMARAKDLGFEPLEAFDEHEPAGKALLGNCLARECVEEIAALKIWDYDQDTGTTYKECDPPSEGYLDSHCCLMGVIEQSRECVESFQSDAVLKTQAANPPTAVIWLEGGVVQWVASDVKMHYLVLDADVEGCGEGEKIGITMENGDTAEVAMTPHSLVSDCLPAWVAQVVEEVESKL